MASSRMRRIAKELADIEKEVDADPQQRITARPKNGGDKITDLVATIPGSPGTPYEGGVFTVDIHIPDDYPFRPPKMKFVTRVYHPNISSQTGAICLDTLSKAWSPVLTIKATLISLQSLFESPEPQDPQDAEVARVMIHHPNLYKKTAHEWAIKYANAPRMAQWLNLDCRTQAEKGIPDDVRYDGFDREIVDRFTPMGFTVERVVEVLKSCPGVDRRLDVDHLTGDQEYFIASTLIDAD